MLIKILPDQIVQRDKNNEYILWEAIKYAATHVNSVDDKDLPKYLNLLLHSLLNEKAQCFVRIDDKREIAAIWITMFLINKVNLEKYLNIQCVYGFKPSPDDVWKKECEMFVELAKKENCSYVGFISHNKRIWDIGKLIDMKEAYRVFKLRV